VKKEDSTIEAEELSFFFSYQMLSADKNWKKLSCQHKAC
jgi:hypothetical protein